MPATAVMASKVVAFRRKRGMKVRVTTVLLPLASTAGHAGSTPPKLFNKLNNCVNAAMIFRRCSLIVMVQNLNGVFRKHAAAIRWRSTALRVTALPANVNYSPRCGAGLII